ncbi:MAG: agmatine deiminase [Clostridiales bacterium]|nr:agmatine deiminase [Clostridiales bacterium]
MSKKIDSTPRKDGFRMPAEYEPQGQVFMIWPERPDNWRDGGKPAQQAYAKVAEAISRFTPVTMLVSKGQYENAYACLPEQVRVVEMSSDDAWVRDCGPTFVTDGKGATRAVNWDFNAWGGLCDGLYFPWDQDDKIARKIAQLERMDYYSTPGFVLEGGSFHVDGDGSLLTTEMCLLSEGRNPQMGKEEIEGMLKEYLNVEKVIWLKDGIDPEETNGHVDDVACFIRPGEVACIWTDDREDPFYEVCQQAFRELSSATDAKGRNLKVHKLAMPRRPVRLKGGFAIDLVCGTAPRSEGDLCIASYMNFLITNNGVVVPQYGDENDALALEQISAMFPCHEVVGVQTCEIVYGGGNIHCITQQQPK